MKPKKGAKPRPRLDTDRIDDIVLALLYLNLHECGAVWKGFDRDSMNRLHQNGFISDPVSKRKSVAFSDDGERQARKLFERMFVVKDG